MTGSDSTATESNAFPNPIQCPEILTEIFTFCLPDVPKGPRQVLRISSWEAPLLLCSVCSSWRSLAISAPRLWQTLHFYYGSRRMFLTDTESITSGIRTWLDRSKSLPLSIRVYFCAQNPKSDKAAKCRLILEILSQEISRWESFEIYADRIWVTPPHYGGFPMLHTPHISGSSINVMPSTAAPHLKRLTLISLCLNPTSVSGIPWDQLVEFSIAKAQTISMVLEVIQCCSRLESLSIPVKEGDEDHALTFRSIIQHNILRRLHLSMVPYFNAVTDRLALPALTDLALTHQSHEAKLCCSQFVAFLTRSNCELQEFTLGHSKFGPGELLECLSHWSCQTLTHLVILQDQPSPPIVDKELLIRLTYSDVDDDVPLCPKLRYLELWDCYCSDGALPDLLGKMIYSRCFGRTPDTQLRSLMLFGPDSAISKEDFKFLHLAKSKGGLEICSLQGCE